MEIGDMMAWVIQFMEVLGVLDYVTTSLAIIVMVYLAQRLFYMIGGR